MFQPIPHWIYTLQEIYDRWPHNEVSLYMEHDNTIREVKHALNGRISKILINDLELRSSRWRCIRVSRKRYLFEWRHSLAELPKNEIFHIEDMSNGETWVTFKFHPVTNPKPVKDINNVEDQGRQ